VASFKRRIRTWRQRHLRHAFELIHADRLARRVVSIEADQSFVKQHQDWTGPVSYRCVQNDGQWTILFKDLAAEHQAAVAERAARQ
jgi:hypothetical protein